MDMDMDMDVYVQYWWDQTCIVDKMFNRVNTFCTVLYWLTGLDWTGLTVLYCNESY